MHETSIVLSTISIVEEEARKHGVSKINSITICIGELTCVEKETLRGCFDVAVESEALAGAKLIIEPIAAVFRCETCGASLERKQWSTTCPKCNGGNMRLEQGRELYVKSFEAD